MAGLDSMSMGEYGCGSPISPSPGPSPSSIVVVFVGAVHTALPPKQGHTAGAMVEHCRVVCTEDRQIITQLGETTILVPAEIHCSTLQHTHCRNRCWYHAICVRIYSVQYHDVSICIMTKVCHHREHAGGYDHLSGALVEEKQSHECTVQFSKGF